MMKTILITACLLGVAITGAVIYSNVHHAEPAAVSPTVAATEPTPAPAPDIDSAPSNTSARPAPKRAKIIYQKTPTTPPPQTATMTGDSPQESVRKLMAPNITFQQKEAIWHQVHDLNHLNPVIDALKQGATDNPDSPAYQATLGKAYLQKASIVSTNGGSMNELGVLGMTADQSFDAALKIDPSNWDAQFYKAVALSYWPAELNKGNEVVQRFSTLIQQQDNQYTQPEFALSYVALGQQYQKLGQSDNAMQTWQAGAAKFPDNTALQQKIAGAQSK